MFSYYWYSLDFVQATPPSKILHKILSRVPPSSALSFVLFEVYFCFNVLDLMVISSDDEQEDQVEEQYQEDQDEEEEEEEVHNVPTQYLFPWPPSGANFPSRFLLAIVMNAPFLVHPSPASSGQFSSISSASYEPSASSVYYSYLPSNPPPLPAAPYHLPKLPWAKLNAIVGQDTRYSYSFSSDANIIDAVTAFRVTHFLFRRNVFLVSFMFFLYCSFWISQAQMSCTTNTSEQAHSAKCSKLHIMAPRPPPRSSTPPPRQTTSPPCI